MLGVQLWLFLWAPLHGRALPVSLGYFLLPLVMVLAGRFEELSANDAALYEALLGPLAQAIAVDDVQAAAAELAKSDERPDSVWLVDADSPLPLDDHGRPPCAAAPAGALAASGLTPGIQP